MPAKKATGKKKGTGKKKPTPPMDPFVFEPPMVAAGPSEYVACSSLGIWLHQPDITTMIEGGHSDTEASNLRDTRFLIFRDVAGQVTLSVIKKAIMQRHGGSALALTLYLNHVGAATKITKDDGASLKDMGVKGVESGEGAQPPVVTIMYDFETARSDDVIVSTEIDLPKSSHGIDLKKYLKAAKIHGAL
eukprot:gene18789-25330_t